MAWKVAGRHLYKEGELQLLFSVWLMHPYLFGTAIDYVALSAMNIINLPTWYLSLFSVLPIIRENSDALFWKDLTQ